MGEGWGGGSEHGSTAHVLQRSRGRHSRCCPAADILKTTVPPLNPPHPALTLMGHLAQEVAVAVPRFLLKVPAGHLTGLMVLVLGQ